MINSDRKNTRLDNQTIFLLGIFGLFVFLTTACEYYHQDCNTPFRYLFFDKTIRFPLSADEAVVNYGLIKSSKYTIFNDRPNAAKATISIYTTMGYDYPRYAPRTDSTTQKDYNKDIHAINIHLRDRSLTINRVIEKLQNDFKQTFTKKRTRMDLVGDYYQMDINDCVSVLVYDDPIFNYVFGLGTVNVLFTYKLTSEEKVLILETNGSIRGD